MIETCSNFKTMVLQSHKTLSDSSSIDNCDMEEKESEDDVNRSKLFYKPFHSNDESKIDESIKILRPNKIVKNENNPKTDSSTTVKQFHCLLCFEICKDDSTLKNHIDKHLEGTELEPYYIFGERNITCRVCNKFFPYRYTFLKHQRKHLDIQPFGCKYEGCTRKFHSKEALRHHHSIHADRNFICSVCAVGFKRKSDLKSHEIIHEDVGVTYECPICNIKCKNRLTRASHMKKHQRKRM
jgi:uncharacterized Zn-finger protein